MKKREKNKYSVEKNQMHVKDPVMYMWTNKEISLSKHKSVKQSDGNAYNGLNILYSSLLRLKLNETCPVKSSKENTADS